jgi:UDP-GlcNAc3NAcA epimerase
LLVILTVIGTRPQFIKAAAVSRVLSARSNLREIIVHTGQHFDDNMSRQFFDELELPAPTYCLDIHGGTHGQMTGRMLQAVEHAIGEIRPDLVLVYGDTNSTLAAALAAAKMHVSVAHVEAGLRSFDRSMPEEINRIVTDHISSLLFCPTRSAMANLRREGIVAGVHHVGDVMYDMSQRAAALARQKSTILARLALTPGSYAVATVHRAESTDEPDKLARIFAWLGERAAETTVVVPLHPRTRLAMDRADVEHGALRMIDPLGYLDMTALVQNAAAVYTDSGGLQKEAYFHRVPCVTLRTTTEWVETVDAGWNRLWTDPPNNTPRREIDDYGNGLAAVRIVELIESAQAENDRRTPK